MSERRRREMPPDRRSSGKQKRLHTLFCLICLRVLSTTGSVSVTPFPPSQPGCSPSTSSLHLQLPFLLLPPTPFLLLAVDPVIRTGLTSGGPLVLGGRRRRQIAQQRLPPQRLWEPRTQPTSTQWPCTSTTKTHAEDPGPDGKERQEAGIFCEAEEAEAAQAEPI
ncbi:hypothetical protein D5F01_LYC14826 [Larimichthys crocea]|uniref:Uncharacterized protein n=1 Tax=Larimichthys crocea TaxID=215358 RepID=A0A6G0I6G1_LARCR|nr:hypothetical protein D5F01_LYC14826 [Larimichthys crocea]